MPVFTPPCSSTRIPSPSRPAKRTRLEPSVTVDDERDPEFWLDDGNIVVVVQDVVAFRVHKSVLARRSQVFSGLFAVPQPPDEANVETMDGHAVVRVHDSLHDFKHLLRALYDGSYTYVAASQLRSCPKFGALAALIRLGHKYDVPHVQETALRRLKAHFADNFNAWKTQPLPPLRAGRPATRCALSLHDHRHAHLPRWLPACGQHARDVIGKRSTAVPGRARKARRAQCEVQSAHDNLLRPARAYGLPRLARRTVPRNVRACLGGDGENSQRREPRTGQRDAYSQFRL
ncbi:hypothetical protein C2E23DRAFT_396105 [Lenzites betulinus]|nr:hypothetical protein C2E23DRAFT_396105 [Lenzites betulinus]